MTLANKKAEEIERRDPRVALLAPEQASADRRSISGIAHLRALFRLAHLSPSRRSRVDLQLPAEVDYLGTYSAGHCQDSPFGCYFEMLHPST
jgi:hypothetical protein